MQHATQTEPADPAKSNSLSESIDRQLTDGAVWVPTVNPPEGGRAEGLSGLEVHFARSRRQRAASAAIAS